MVFLIADVNESKGIRRYAPWIVEPAVRSSLATERSQEASRGIQHLECKRNLRVSCWCVMCWDVNGNGESEGRSEGGVVFEVADWPDVREPVWLIDE